MFCISIWSTCCKNALSAMIKCVLGHLSSQQNVAKCPPFTISTGTFCTPNYTHSALLIFSPLPLKHAESSTGLSHIYFKMSILSAYYIPAVSQSVASHLRSSWFCLFYIHSFCITVAVQKN